eukprot:1138432-Pelagomonas_calceolata.AAC.3
MPDGREFNMQYLRMTWQQGVGWGVGYGNEHMSNTRCPRVQSFGSGLVRGREGQVYPGSMRQLLFGVVSMQLVPTHAMLWIRPCYGQKGASLP